MRQQCQSVEQIFSIQCIGNINTHNCKNTSNCRSIYKHCLNNEYHLRPVCDSTYQSENIYTLKAPAHVR